MQCKNPLCAFVSAVCVSMLLSSSAVHGAALLLQSSGDVFSAYASVHASAKGPRFDDYNQPIDMISESSGSTASVETSAESGLTWWPTAIAEDTEGSLGMFASVETSFSASLMTGVNGAGDPESGGAYFYVNPDVYANYATLFAFASGVAHYYRPSWKQAGYGGGATEDNLQVSLSYDLSLRCLDYVEFVIAPRRGEQIGDTVPVTIGPGWTGQVRYDGTVYHPDSDSERVIQARIGDTIGLKFDNINVYGGWGDHTEDHVPGSFKVLGDIADSGVGISIPLTTGLSETLGQAPSAMPEENHFVYTDIFHEDDPGDIGVPAPLWLALGALAEEYDLTITDNALSTLVLPSTLPYSEEMNVQYFDGSQWLDAWDADEDGHYGFYPGASIGFEDPVTRIRLTGIDWTGGSLPDTFALGLMFADVGTQVDIVATGVVPEPATLTLLALAAAAGLRRRQQ